MTAGGVLGAIACLLIPGIGTVLAGGLFAATFSAAVIGAAAGGVVGGLVGLGVDEEEARFCEKELQNGKAIVTVAATVETERAKEILHRCQGYAYLREHPLV